MSNVESWIDIETARRLLRNTCSFLEQDERGIADFVIADGKEAIILTIYTNAFFVIDEKYKLKFRPSLGDWSPKESFSLLPLHEGEWFTDSIIPVYSSPLKSYIDMFPSLMRTKYLFMVDGRNYSRRKYDQTGRFYYEFYEKEQIIKDILQKAKENNIHPSDVVVWISNADGTYGEDFWEYIAGITLREKGYFITRYGEGDLSAYSIPEYLDTLVKHGFLEKGCFVEELEMLKQSGVKRAVTYPSSYESIVIEAESSRERVKSHNSSGRAGVGQIIHKYLTYENGNNYGIVTGPYCTGYEDIHCHDEKCSCKSVGLISCDERGSPVYLPPKREYYSKTKEKIELVKLLIKSVLLKNLPFNKRQGLVGRANRPEEYLKKLLDIDIDSIVEELAKFS